VVKKPNERPRRRRGPFPCCCSHGGARSLGRFSSFVAWAIVVSSLGAVPRRAIAARDDAGERQLRQRDIRNDVGLLSEEYDPRERRLVGNFPQAFSHISLVNSASNLSREEGPAESRRRS